MQIIVRALCCNQWGHTWLVVENQARLFSCFDWLLLVDIHEFWWESVCKLSITRDRKFDLISQSGWNTLTTARSKLLPSNFKQSYPRVMAKALWLAKGRPEICFALPAFITRMITSNFLLHSAVQRYGYYFMYCLIFLEIFHSIMVLLLGSSIPCYWRRSRLIVFSAFRDNNSKLKEVGTIQVLVSQKPCLSFGCLFFASIVAFERSRN